MTEGVVDGYLRRLYAGGRPNRVARVLNRVSARLYALGIGPRRLVTLQVRGRRTGRLITFPMVVADLAGERYLVSMLGEQTNWVQNLRAAGGSAVLLHGRREVVHLEEVEAAERPPILRRYLECAPGARAHLPVHRASVAAFERIATQTPVFRLPRPPVVAHRFFLAILRSPVGRLLGGVCELRFVGRVSGRDIALPVQCAPTGTQQLVIYVGRAGTKRWWRNFRGGHVVRVRVGGVVHTGHGRVVDVDDPDRAWVERVYARRHRKVHVVPDDPLLLVDLAADGDE
ncbi:nitroreductase/quinone reductase family protein [Pseudonocardia saturnea]